MIFFSYSQLDWLTATKYCSETSTFSMSFNLHHSSCKIRYIKRTASNSLFRTCPNDYCRLCNSKTAMTFFCFIYIFIPSILVEGMSCVVRAHSVMFIQIRILCINRLSTALAHKWMCTQLMIVTSYTPWHQRTIEV